MSTRDGRWKRGRKKRKRGGRSPERYQHEHYTQLAARSGVGPACFSVYASLIGPLLVPRYVQSSPYSGRVQVCVSPFLSLVVLWVCFIYFYFFIPTDYLLVKKNIEIWNLINLRPPVVDSSSIWDDHGRASYAIRIAPLSRCKLVYYSRTLTPFFYMITYKFSCSTMSEIRLKRYIHRKISFSHETIRGLDPTRGSPCCCFLYRAYFSAPRRDDGCFFFFPTPGQIIISLVAILISIFF